MTYHISLPNANHETKNNLFLLNWANGPKSKLSILPTDIVRHIVAPYLQVPDATPIQYLSESDRGKSEIETRGVPG